MLPLMLNIIALVLFILGFVLLIRAFRVPAEDRARYFRAGVGSMAAAAGNATLLKSQSGGFLLLLLGVMLILTSNTGQRRIM